MFNIDAEKMIVSSDNLEDMNLKFWALALLVGGLVDEVLTGT